MIKRNCGRAIIIKNNKILLQRGRGVYADYYIVPGGKAEELETIEEATIRECMEEMGARIKIKRFLFLREYIGKNHEFPELHSSLHQVDFFFEADLLEINSELATMPDPDQLSVEWIDLEDVSKVRLFPKFLKDIITPNGLKFDRRYYGDIN